MNLNPLSNTLTFKTPSGFDVTIREQNGEDDEIISKMKNSTDGSAVNKFLANIITSHNGTKVTHEGIILWKNKDKYYTLLKSRIFSLGGTITYKHQCVNLECQKESTFEENLNLYDRDFSKPLEESEIDFQYQVTPYVNGEKLEEELTLSSGKKIKYKYLNGESEKQLLAANKDEISKNTELLVRGIQWFHEEKWQLLLNFRSLSSKDMREIRENIKKFDLPFDAVSEVKCPFCQNRDKISLMAQADFFFPLETL